MSEYIKNRKHIWSSEPDSSVKLHIYKTHEEPSSYTLIIEPGNYMLEIKDGRAQNDYDAIKRFYKALIIISQSSKDISEVAKEAKKVLEKKFELVYPYQTFVKIKYEEEKLILIKDIEIDYMTLAEGKIGRFDQYVRHGIPFVIANSNLTSPLALLEAENIYFKNKTKGQLDIIQDYNRYYNRTILLWKKARKLLPDLLDLDEIELLMSLFSGRLYRKNQEEYEKGLITITMKENGEKEEFSGKDSDGFKVIIYKINEIRKYRFLSTMRKKWRLAGLSAEGKWEQDFTSKNNSKKVDVEISESSFVFPIPQDNPLYNAFKKIHYDKNCNCFRGVNDLYESFITFFGENWLRQREVIVYFGDANNFSPESYLVDIMDPSKPKNIFRNWTNTESEKEKSITTHSNSLEDGVDNRSENGAVHYAYKYFRDLFYKRVNVLPFLEKAIIRPVEILGDCDIKYVLNNLIKSITKMRKTPNYVLILDLDDDDIPLLIYKGQRDSTKNWLEERGFIRVGEDLIGRLNKLTYHAMEGNTIVPLKYLSFVDMFDIIRKIVYIIHLSSKIKE